MLWVSWIQFNAPHWLLQFTRKLQVITRERIFYGFVYNSKYDNLNLLWAPSKLSARSSLSSPLTTTNIKIDLHIGNNIFSAKNKNRGRASPGGGGPYLLRQGLHHQAQVHGGEHRGRAAWVHHLEEGGQDAQLRHRARWHQVGGDWGSKVTRLTQFGLTQQTEVTFHKKYHYNTAKHTIQP